MTGHSMTRRGPERTPEATIDVEVPFHDGDPMGVTWHGNYLRYLEAARSALLDDIGHGYREMEVAGCHWHVVEARVKFVMPTVFGQHLEVTAAIEEYERRLRIAYLATERDSGRPAVRARTTQVAVDKASGEACRHCPEAFVDKVRARLTEAAGRA